MDLKQFIEKVKYLIDKNYTYSAIAKELNMALSTVKNRMTKAGLKTKHNPYARVNLNFHEVKNLVEQNFSTRRIAKKLKTSQTNVRHWLNKWGLKTSKQFSSYNNLHNANCYEDQKLRGLYRKLHFVNKLGGKCKVCGYNKNLASLTFHHRDPHDKSFRLDVRNLTNKTMDVLINEADKCDLLCHNCHHELHNPMLEVSKVENLLKN